MRRAAVGLDRLREGEVERLVDQPPLGAVVPVDEGDGDAAGARPPRTPDAVQEDLLVLRALVVHDVRDVGDVDATGRDVGRHQHVDLAGAEGPQGLLAGALAQVAVDRGGREPPVDHVGGDLVAGPLGAAEDHRQAAALGLQDAGEHLALVHRVRPVDEDLGVRDGPVLVGLLGADVRRLLHEAPRHGHDGPGHRGGEQHRLPLAGDLLQDPLDVGQEAQVEHLVGLVQDEHADGREVQVPLPGQVEQAAGGADDHVDASAQGLDLRLEGPAAVDRDDADAADAAGVLEVLGDLHGQLAGRHDAQRLRQPVGALGLALHALQQRYAEAQRLAGAGARLADQVVARQRDRQGHRLDGEGRGDAHPGERLDGLRQRAERGEAVRDRCRVRGKDGLGCCHGRASRAVASTDDGSGLAAAALPGSRQADRRAAGTAANAQGRERRAPPRHRRC